MSKIDRLARALWNHERKELQTGGTQPSFYNYADGAGEPCVWDDQDAELHEYFRKLARRLIRAMA